MAWKVYEDIDNEDVTVDIRLNDDGTYDIDLLENIEGQYILMDFMLDVCPEERGMDSWQEMVARAEAQFDVKLDETPIDESR